MFHHPIRRQDYFLHFSHRPLYESLLWQFRNRSFDRIISSVFVLPFVIDRSSVHFRPVSDDCSLNSLHFRESRADDINCVMCSKQDPVFLRRGDADTAPILM